MKQSLASLPYPFRYSLASGSVFDSCVSFLRFLPLKSPNPLLSESSSSFGRKLFIDAQASMSVPSTEKCSLLSSPRCRA
mgnify:CR=1 FL=1